MILKDISKAVALLEAGNIIAIPTETVYGLAGNIYDEQAIQRIFTLKKRPLFNPLIVHIASKDALTSLVSEIPPKAQQLADAFWPGSLTLVLPKKDTVPDLITAGNDTVGVRVPNHPTTLALLSQLTFPLAAPSANPFGHISPTKASHVDGYFKQKLAMVLDGGDCNNGIESTIVGFENNAPIVYRLGAISLEEIESVIGKVTLKNKKENAPNAPGMLSRHYAPDTRTYLVDNVSDFVLKHPNKKIGVITFQTPMEVNNISVIHVLSPTGNFKEAASKLYATLHQLDAMGLDIIVAQRFPEKDLGIAINDRLERATKRN